MTFVYACLIIVALVAWGYGCVWLFRKLAHVFHDGMYGIDVTGNSDPYLEAIASKANDTELPGEQLKMDVADPYVVNLIEETKTSK